MAGAPSEKLFVIGDVVHGCAAELKTLLNKLPLDPSSTVVFVGDYIDRGPQSRGVIDTVLQLRRYCRVVTLSGNHEAMLQDFLLDPRGHGAGMFIYNGGGATLASYADEHGRYEIPEEHLKFFDELAVSYQNDDFFFVHAGVPDVPLAELNDAHKKDMLWVRKSFHRSEFRWAKTIVHGHSPVPEVYFSDKRINVDTGCVFERKLTAVELPSRKIYSVTRDKAGRRVHLRDFASNRIAVRYAGTVPVYVYHGAETLEFETVDYSEFGMLVRYIGPHTGDVLAVAEKITGHIGSDDAKLVEFEGEVVRLQDHELGRCYALKIFALGAPAE